MLDHAMPTAAMLINSWCWFVAERHRREAESADGEADDVHEFRARIFRRPKQHE